MHDPDVRAAARRAGEDRQVEFLAQPFTLGTVEVGTDHTRVPATDHSPAGDAATEFCRPAPDEERGRVLVLPLLPAHERPLATADLADGDHAESESLYLQSLAQHDLPLGF